MTLLDTEERLCAIESIPLVGGFRHSSITIAWAEPRNQLRCSCFLLSLRFWMMKFRLDMSLEALVSSFRDHLVPGSEFGPSTRVFSFF